MMIFDEFTDALEEAKFCADEEKKVYRILAKPEGFCVLLKGKSRTRNRGIEVGYRGYRCSIRSRV